MQTYNLTPISRPVASAGNKQPRTWASARHCWPGSDHPQSSWDAAESTIALTLINGWITLSHEGGPSRRSYGP